MRANRLYKIVILMALQILLFSACGTRGEDTAGSDPARTESPSATAVISPEEAITPAGTGTEEAGRDGPLPKAFSEDTDAIETAAASVVKLEAYDRFDKKTGSGSGFCAYEDTLLITAAHVTANMEYMIATRDDGTMFRITAVVAGSTENDIAICRLPEGVTMTPLPTAEELPKRGEAVTVIGSQFGVTNLVTTGNIAGIYQEEGVQRLVFTAPVSSGNSGGPVFDPAGNVVGIVSGTYDKGQNMNFAVPISGAEALYKTNLRNMENKS